MLNLFTSSYNCATNYMYKVKKYIPLLFFFQSLLQDISSHQRIVDSVVEKAQSVLQSSSNPDVANFITEVSSRYETLAQAAKVG